MSILVPASCNHVYGGLIKAPSYKNEKFKIVQGTHEAIIPEKMFWQAYYKLQDKIRPQGPKIIDDNIPLRGFLLCQSCGGLHTGGKSKGRSAYYYYYRCKKCNGENYSANKVHNEICEILKHLSLDKSCIDALKIESEIQLEVNLKDRNRKLQKINSEYTSISEKINALEEKYITNKIEQSTYEKWFPIFSKDLNGKTMELDELKKDDSKTRELYNTSLPYLTDLNWIYNQANIEGKQTFLKGIFLGGFTKEKIGGRTGLLNPMFHHNSLKIEALLRTGGRESSPNLTTFPICTGGGTTLH